MPTVHNYKVEFVLHNTHIFECWVGFTVTPAFVLFIAKSHRKSVKKPLQAN